MGGGKRQASTAGGEDTKIYLLFEKLDWHIVIREMSNDYFHCFVKCDIDLPLSILDQFFKA